MAWSYDGSDGDARGYASCLSKPGHPTASCLQSHYHPHGALYIGLAGRTLYRADYEGFDAWIDGGDVRWESVTIAGEDKMYCTVSASPPPHASTRARSPLHPLLHHR